MSSGTAMSIQFLLVRWSVGVGCKSFWYSICGEEVSQGRVYLQPLILLFPSSGHWEVPIRCWSSPFLLPVDPDQALEQAPHWWEESLQAAEPSLQTP